MKYRMVHAYLILSIGVLTFAIFQTSGHHPARANVLDESIRDGILTIVWGDPDPRRTAGAERIHTYLDESGGRTSRLVIDEDAAASIDLVSLNGRRVRVTVQTDPADSPPDGGDDPDMLRVTAVRPLGEPRAATALAGNQRIATLLCRFDDTAAGFKPLDYYANMTGDSYPQLGDYWGAAQSYGMIDLMGSAAFGHYTLPFPRSYYIPGGIANLTAVALDCIYAADADVDFSLYAGINLVFNDELDGYAYGGRRTLNLDGAYRSWGITWLPPWGAANISVVAHEVGHTYGLPHSSGPYGLTYDSPWDVMSDSYVYCAYYADPAYGCTAQGTIAYHKDMLGWIPDGRKYTHAGGTQTITLERLSMPQTGDYLMAQIPVNDSTTQFYTVEVRRKAGYDIKLPGAGIIIHEVQTYRPRPAQVVDADGDGDLWDEGVLWQPGETFYGPDHIVVRVDEATDTGAVVTISNEAPSAWTGAMIGQEASGWYEESAGSIRVEAQGGGIDGPADQFYYVSQGQGGSQSFTARITAWDAGGGEAAEAGLMFRGSLEPDAPHYAVQLTGPDNAIRLKWRDVPGGATASFNGPSSIPLPVWLKVMRTGPNYAAFYSPDNLTWTQIDAPRTLSGFPYEALYGLAVASHNSEVAAGATFDELNAQSWGSVAIGAAAQGNAEETSALLTLQASGLNIYSTADSFFYHYLTGKGDLDLRVKLSAWDANGRPEAKTGLMIRASMEANAPQFTIHVAGPQRALQLKYRPVAGGATSSVSGPATWPMPVWLRLVKSGGVVAGYYSADGVHWTLLDKPQAITALDAYFYGFVATSGYPGIYVTASFGDVTVGPLPVPPSPTPTDIPTDVATEVATVTPTFEPTSTKSMTATPPAAATATTNPTVTLTTTPAPTADVSLTITPSLTPGGPTPTRLPSEPAFVFIPILVK